MILPQVGFFIFGFLTIFNIYVTDNIYFGSFNVFLIAIFEFLYIYIHIHIHIHIHIYIIVFMLYTLVFIIFYNIFYFCIILPK